MAYYDALIAAWNGATQPPVGVTGAPLTAQMSPAQKIATINGWTITGSLPTSFFVTGAQVLNCINYAEFKALTATQQSNLLAMLAVPGNLLGGSGSVAFMVDGMIIDFFLAAGPKTIAALMALAQASVTPWWQANGYSSAIGASDLAAAGGLT